MQFRKRAAELTEMEIKATPAVYAARDDLVEVFVDNVHTVNIVNGVMRVELTATRMDEMRPPKPPTARAVPVVRFAMPLPAAMQMGALITMAAQQGGLKHDAAPSPQAPPSTPSAAH